MNTNKPSWKKFQKLKFDGRKISKHARRVEGATTRHARKFLVRRLNNLREVRKHIVLWLVMVGCLIVAAGVQLIWFQQSYITTAPDEGGTYAEGMVGSIETLNPLYASTTAEIAASKLIFSSLFDYDGSGKLRENVATSIKSNKQGTVYTVTLNPSVRWHDGTHLTARDVVFTINLIKEPETRSRLLKTWQDITVKALDDQTVQFILPSAYASFPHALTFSILPEHILGDVPPSSIRQNTFSLSPIGTGPFKLRLLQSSDDQTAGHEIVSLSAFDDYYRGDPKLDRFEIHAFSTPELVAKALQTGQINAAVGVTDVQSFIDNPKFSVSSHPINNGVYAILNTTSETLKDKKVRRALQLSADTKSLRKQVPFTPPELDLPLINDQIDVKLPKAPEHNVKKAAALLDKAGWKLKNGVRTNKKGQKLALSVVTTKNSDYESSIESLAGDWRELGVDVQTSIYDVNDPAQNFSKDILQPRSFDVLIYELTIGADPDVFAYWHSSQIGESELNFSNYDNALADDALISARLRDELKLRDLKYKTFAEQWLSDVPAIGLYRPTMTYIHTKNTDSIKKGQKLIRPVSRYFDVLYWTVGQKQVYNTP